ncbi:MAG: hypothetical protein HY234_12010 [Acidobacteria bacterium]|nr:hypothetical protein [Acidobacteriota bacterium]MBI3663756.1 hypothetical protein [Acidobacteriota bacterium]
MPEGIEYVNEEFGPSFGITIGKCEFLGFLLERKAGGFDLFLDRQGSDLECLELDQMTWLRHQAVDKGCVYIVYFPGPKLTKEVRRAAQDRLGAWLQQSFGLPFDPNKKVYWVDDE